MKVDRVIISPNFNKGWLYRRDGTYQGPDGEELPNKLFIHATRSGQPMPPRDHDTEMLSTTNWFSSTASNASSHLVISPTETVRMVEDGNTSWHAREHSHQAWAIETTQPNWDNPYEDGHYARLAEAVVHYMALGVKLVHLQTLEWGDIKGGIIGHEDSAQGVRDGKSDPGALFSYQRLLTEVLAIGEEEMTDADFERIRGIVREEIDAHKDEDREIGMQSIDKYLFTETVDAQGKVRGLFPGKRTEFVSSITKFIEDE